MVFDVGLPVVEIYNTQGPVHGNRCLEVIPVVVRVEQMERCHDMYDFT